LLIEKMLVLTPLIQQHYNPLAAFIEPSLSMFTLLYISLKS
jgi:hypothetical protein